MGLRSIWRHEQDLHPPTTRQKLNRDAISALFWVILTALLGIILLSALGLMLRFGLFGAIAGENSNSFADEALSILGNIGSAAIGGLVGWLTRDQLDQKDTGYQQLPPEPTPDQAMRKEPAMTSTPDEYGDSDTVDQDRNDGPPAVETADDYGPTTEPADVPAPPDNDQNPGHGGEA